MSLNIAGVQVDRFAIEMMHEIELPDWEDRVRYPEYIKELETSHLDGYLPELAAFNAMICATPTDARIKYVGTLIFLVVTELTSRKNLVQP